MAAFELVFGSLFGCLLALASYLSRRASVSWPGGRKDTDDARASWGLVLTILAFLSWFICDWRTHFLPMSTVGWITEDQPLMGIEFVEFFLTIVGTVTIWFALLRIRSVRNRILWWTPEARERHDKMYALRTCRMLMIVVVLLGVTVSCNSHEQEQPCAPNGCQCIKGVWHGADGKPSTAVDGQTIYCEEVDVK